ncbi:MAG: hypothetical protein IPN59_11545 [Holophaga sp.]|nr:hypothetical protein [Holophaga sp.]
MSRTLRLLAGTAVVLAGMSTAQAQDFKFSGLVQVWYTQMLDSNLRNNSVAKLLQPRGEYKENGRFSVRRTEIKVAGKILDGVKFEVMLDPSIATSTTNPHDPAGCRHRIRTGPWFGFPGRAVQDPADHGRSHLLL